ncbi:MAG: hypothetical protein QW599_06095 [Nitrososphaerota archaeon]
MEGLAWLLQVALVALAFGCGIPALVYLAYKGNLREPKKREEAPIIEGFPETPFFTAMKKGEDAQRLPAEVFTAMKSRRSTDEDVERLSELERPGWERIYDQVAIKGFVYIPKPVLRRIVREILEEQRALEEAKAKSEAQGDSEKPVKPKPSDRLEVRRG